jgi:hypothetical protein
MVFYEGLGAKFSALQGSQIDEGQIDDLTQH